MYATRNNENENGKNGHDSMLWSWFLKKKNALFAGQK